jgi:hypothetical protein
MASELSTFPLHGQINLVVRLGHGRVAVAARDDLADATVRLSPHDPGSGVLDRVTVSMTGSTLLVAGPRQGGWADLIGGRRRNRDGIDASIDVPTGTPVEIVSASEHLTVTGRCGDANIATTAADINIDHVAGDLRLRYGTASSRVGTVTGSAQLKAGTATASFGEIGGSLHCDFGNGQLSAEVTHGDLRSRAGSASARIGAVYGDVDLAFGRGPITIGIPAGVAAHLEVTSGTGLLASDLPVEETPADDARQIRVRARTGAGDIHLRRAPAA